MSAQAPPRPARVLIIAPSPNMVGGQSVQASRLIRNLQKEPSVAVSFQPVDVPPPAILNPILKLPYLRTVLNVASYVTSLFRSIPRADIVHIFSAGVWSFTLWTLPALLVARAFRKRIILNYRDGRAAEHMREWRTALPAVRLADAVVCPSGYLVDVFREFGVEARSIFNMLDFGSFTFRQRAPLRPVFMTNRILDPLYNVECILRAFRIVQNRYPEASLTIAHDGESRASLERYAQDLQLRHTRFVGTVPYRDVPALYDQADVYLTAPFADCMPGSLLECSASGLPIVATDVGGIPYIVTSEHTALLVKSDDHEALAAACVRLLEQPDLARALTENARVEVRKYAWEGGVREQWLEMYAQLMRRA